MRFLRPFLLAASLVLPGLAQATCPSRSDDLQRPLNAAQAAFASMDNQRFQQAATATDEALDCLSEPVSAAMAAAVHRHEGLIAFLADDPARARAAFRSALALQPGYRLPEDIAPAGHPLTSLYEEARALGPGPEEQVWTGPGTSALIDGVISNGLPADRPVIVQILSVDGSVLSTTYLRVGARPPDALLLTPPEGPPIGAVTTPPIPIEPLPPAPTRSPRPLLIAGGASLVGAAAAYGYSALVAHQYQTEGLVADEDLETLIGRNHAAVFTAAGLGATGLGLGVGAMLRVSF